MVNRTYAKQRFAKQECTKRRHFHMVGFVALGVTLAILGAQAAHAAFPPPPPSANGPIYSILSGKKLCLQPAAVHDGISPQGAGIILEPCNGSLVQQWQRVSVSGSTPDHYLNQFSGLCFGANGSAANYTRVEQGTCSSIINQRWAYVSGDNTYIPNVVASELAGGSAGYTFCLDIPGGQATAGTFVQIYVCNGTDAQRWQTP